MSLPLPDLDDRSFDDLMKEVQSLIPIYNKEWTNFNPSDPGITLLELFAWLSEMVIYRTNQVPEENYQKFLELIGIKPEFLFSWEKIPGNDDERLIEFLIQNFGIEWIKAAEISKNDDGKTIRVTSDTNFLSLTLNDEKTNVNIEIDDGRTDEFIVKTENGELNIYELDTDESIASGISKGLESISGRYRAITSDDYEFLANERMMTLDEGLEGRTICVNNRDLEFSKPDEEKPGTVSVIIIPGCREDSVYCKDALPTNELKNEIKKYLDSRRLITTRVHVVEPDYQTVTLEVEIALEENTDENSVTNKAIDRIHTYFDPVKGGQEGKGWPLGRDLYRPEIYHLLEGVQGIDHVVDITIRVDDVEVDYVTIEEYQLILIADPVVIKVYHE